MNETVPRRMYETLGPNVKLILILRDPVDRLHSDYNMNVSILIFIIIQSYT